MNIYLPGVINNIMTAIYHVDENIVYRQLNKQIYKETAPLHYEKHKDDKIDQALIDYLKTCPAQFGRLFLANNDNGISVVVQHGKLFKDFYTTKETHLYVTYQDTLFINFITRNLTTIELIIDSYKLNAFFVHDILTIYNIYKNRKSLMHINKHYAIQKTLSYLHRFKHNQMTFYRYYVYYHYLILNCIIFNMDIKSNLLANLYFQPITIHNTNKMGDHNRYLNQLLENPICLEPYQIEKQLMIDEINKLEPIIINIINNFD